MEELKKKLESIVPTLNKQELDARFPEIAEFLMMNYGIETQGRVYLLNEIEFYYYDSLYDDKRTEKGKSRITFERTAPVGSWFIHNYGVDITFDSDKAKGFGGGILIRSIEEKDTQKVTTGPINCVNELWEESVDAFSTTAPNPHVVRIQPRQEEMSEPTLRIKVGESDRWQSLWRFTIKNKEVSK